MAASSPKSDYYRIELDYPLDMGETAMLTLTDNGGKLQDFVPMPTKTMVMTSRMPPKADTNSKLPCSLRS